MANRSFRSWTPYGSADGRQPDLVPCEKHETDRYQRRGATDRFHTSLATIVPTVGRALVRISRAAARRRWAFVLAWVVLLVLALPFAGRAQSKLSNGGFEVPGPSPSGTSPTSSTCRATAPSRSRSSSRPPPREAAAARLADVHREALAVDGRIRFTTAPTASADGRTRARHRLRVGLAERGARDQPAPGRPRPGDRRPDAGVRARRARPLRIVPADHRVATWRAPRP